MFHIKDKIADAKDYATYRLVKAMQNRCKHPGEKKLGFCKKCGKNTLEERFNKK